MKIKVKKLRSIIKEAAISNMAKRLANSDPYPRAFVAAYSYLNKSPETPEEGDYGQFAGEKAILWKADGALEFLISILINLIAEDFVKEELRDTIESAARQWLEDNGYRVVNGNIVKGLKDAS